MRTSNDQLTNVEGYMYKSGCHSMRGDIQANQEEASDQTPNKIYARNATNSASPENVAIYGILLPHFCVDV